MLVSMFLSVRYFKMVILKSHFKKAITKLLILTFLKIYRACVCENSHSSFFIDVFSILRIFFLMKYNYLLSQKQTTEKCHSIKN